MVQQNKYHATNKRASSTAPVSNKQVDGDDEEEQSRDDWTPTPEIFQSFLKRDAELAASNLTLAMSGSGKFPMSMRDLKDALLHSVDVIERTLNSFIAAGRITTDGKGRYSLLT